jgi:hypothetical protein
MTTDVAKGGYKPAHTLSIPEINNDHAEISLQSVSCQSTTKGIRVSGSAYFAHTNKRQEIRIDVGSKPGSYQFHTYTNTRRTP